MAAWLQWALGDKAQASYGDVPYIFKVLSIGQALSIQVCARVCPSTGRTAPSVGSDLGATRLLLWLWGGV